MGQTVTPDLDDVCLALIWLSHRTSRISRLVASDNRCRDEEYTPVLHFNRLDSIFSIIIIINPWTARVVGASQIIMQPVCSIFPCSALPSGTCRSPGLSIPWCCLSTSSSLCLVFFPISLCLVRWFWPDLMNGKLYHTTAVCISLHVVQLPAGSWHGLPRCNMFFVWDV